jgi:CubicO group peptidase (beta-lactamase class C family)
VTLRLPATILALAVAGLALAAPDEAALLKPKSLADVWSRMDEFHAARGVQKSSTPRPLKRAEKTPALGLDEFLDTQRNTGLLVLKGDTVLAERYQYGKTAQHRFASASVAKTVLGMLVGIALHEKKIASLEDRVVQYLPALKGHPYAEVSIRQLLTMSSGIAFSENWKTRDDGLKLIDNTIWQKTEGGIDAIREWRTREAPAGTRFRYASSDSQVLGLVLREAVGMPLATYLSEKIWQPMGAEANATWLLDKAGYETGYCCLNAVLRDYARFGMLLANHGALDGKQIIPAEWVKAATTPEAPHLRVGTATPNNGYGYQTWLLGDHARRPRESGDPVSAFAALGIHGQAIFVDPASKLVVVHTAVWADPNDRAARGVQFRLWNSVLSKLSQE